jgi:carbon storage regulator
MLVLSRKESQRIRLGSSIVVTVVRVAGDKVRLGIEAPHDMLILRDELQAYEASDSAVAGGGSIMETLVEDRSAVSSPIA